MNPQQFVAKWGPGGPSFKLNERQGAQGHFMDLCSLLGVPTPGSTAGSNYIFEQDTLVLGAPAATPTCSFATISRGRTRRQARILTWR